MNLCSSSSFSNCCASLLPVFNNSNCLSLLNKPDLNRFKCSSVIVTKPFSCKASKRAEAVELSVAFPNLLSNEEMTSNDDVAFLVSADVCSNASVTFAITSGFRFMLLPIPAKSALLTPSLILSLRACTASAACFPSFLNC